MIRGILLLILSCVVLTLSQSPCTCEQGTYDTVNEYAENLYPVISAADIDSIKPDAGYTELVNRCSKLSSKTLYKDTTTAQFQAMETEAKTYVNDISEEIKRLKAQKEEVQKELKMVTESMNKDCAYLDPLTEIIHEPLPAIDHCTRYLYFQNRRHYCEEVIKKYDAIIALRVDIQIQWNTCLGVITNCISISKNIDNIVKLSLGLTSRSTALLGLVDPLLAVVTNTVSGLLTTLTGLKVKIDAVLKIAGLKVIADIDVQTNINLNLIRNTCFEHWGVLERCGGYSFNDLQLIVPELLHNVDIVNFLVRTLLNGYLLGKNSQLLCSGYNDKSSKTMSCTYATKIDIDVNVAGLVKLDINIAALKLAHCCRVALLALTGSHCVNTKVHSSSADGTVVIDIESPRDVHEMIRSVYQKPEIVQECSIDQITSSGKINEDVLAAVQDKATIEELKSRLERTISDCKNSVEQVKLRIGASLDIEASLIADVDVSVRALLTTVVPSELAQLAFDRCVAHKTGLLDVLQTAFSIFDNTRLQVLAKVSLCQLALVQAKVDLDLNPGNKLYSDRYAKCHQAYMDALSAAIRIHAQFSLLCDSLKADIDVKVNVLDIIKVDLLAKVDAIVKGVVKVLSVLKVEIMLNLQKILGCITDCIIAFRPTCAILECNFLNLESQDEEILLSVKLTDVLSMGQTLDELHLLHCAAIRASLILSLGCTDVEVNVVIGSGDHHEYHCRITK